MAVDYEKLFNAIRKKSTPQVWSAGVTLARENKIVKDAEDADSVSFVVLTGARGKSLEVQLFPRELEWLCECPSTAEACEHVAAAIITLHSADKKGEEVPVHRPEIARLVYRFFEEDGVLAIERMRTSDGSREVPFAGLLGDRVLPGQPTIVQAPGDLEVDLALGTWRRGRIPKTDMAKLLAALAKVDGRMTLDGAAVSASTKPVVPQLVVEDAAGGGFLAKLTGDDATTRVFRNGAAQVAAVLRPIDAEAGLSEGERRPLERGRVFAPDEASELLQLIGRFEKKIPVRVTSKRLPRGEVEPPRLELATENLDDRLSVLATLVYGDPPIARVDRGSLTLLDAKNAVPFRDERAEQRLASRLAGGLGLEIGRRAVYEGQDAVGFAQKLDAFQRGNNKDLMEIHGHAWEDFTLQGPQIAGKVKLDAEGVLDLRFTSDDDELDPMRVMKAWGRGWNVAPLSGGGFAPLPVKWLATYGPLIANLLAAKGDRDELPPSAVGDVVRLSEALGQRVPPRFDKLKALVGDFATLPAAQLPGDLAADLRPYQKEGVAWLQFHRQAGIGALLADDMGLGKTLQALCAVRGRTLVVAPTSVLLGWAKEAARFRPALQVSVYHGPGRALDPKADVTLTTWALLRLDADLLAKAKWDTVVLDEAQTIKNPESQVAKAAHRMSAPFRVCLSGTPIENRLDDLWSQMAFLEPGFLGTLEAFQERYVTPIGAGDALRAQELRQRIRPFLLRRLKRDVAPDLPPRTELIERCELGPEERTLYDALRAAAKKEVMEELARGGNVLAALELLLRLRQAASHSGLVPGQDELVAGGVASSAKVELLMELLDEIVAEGHKVLVFSQWTSLLDRVEPHLAAAGINFLRLDGSTVDRQAVVDGFQADDGPPVLLLSLKAGGTGLTLTAADHVVLLDPWWNPAVEDQAADRAHRIGQTKPVFVHRLVAADTVEERILALQENKRKLADAALGQGGGGSAALTRDDLLTLLS